MDELILLNCPIRALGGNKGTCTETMDGQYKCFGRLLLYMNVRFVLK